MAQDSDLEPAPVSEDTSGGVGSETFEPRSSRSRRRSRVVGFRTHQRIRRATETRAEAFPCIDPALDEAALRHQALLAAAKDRLAQMHASTETFVEEHLSAGVPVDDRTKSEVMAIRRALLVRRYGGEQSDADTASSAEAAVSARLTTEVDALMRDVRMSAAGALPPGDMSAEEILRGFDASNAAEMRRVARADAARWVDALLREHAIELPRHGHTRCVRALYPVLLGRLTKVRLAAIRRIHIAIARAERAQSTATDGHAVSGQRESGPSEQQGDSDAVPAGDAAGQGNRPGRTSLSKGERRRRRQVRRRVNSTQSAQSADDTCEPAVGCDMDKGTSDSPMTAEHAKVAQPPSGLPAGDRFAAHSSDPDSGDATQEPLPPYLRGLELPERRRIFEVGVATVRPTKKQKSWYTHFGDDGRVLHDPGWAPLASWEQPLDQIPDPGPDAPKVADLCAGLGGFSRAVQLAGGRVVYAMDNNASVKPLYDANRGAGAELTISDLYLPDTWTALVSSGAGVAVAGTPCRDWSSARHVDANKGYHVSFLRMRASDHGPPYKKHRLIAVFARGGPAVRDALAQMALAVIDSRIPQEQQGFMETLLRTGAKGVWSAPRSREGTQVYPLQAPPGTTKSTWAQGLADMVVPQVGAAVLKALFAQPALRELARQSPTPAGDDTLPDVLSMGSCLIDGIYADSTLVDWPTAIAAESSEAGFSWAAMCGVSEGAFQSPANLGASDKEAAPSAQHDREAAGLVAVPPCSLKFPEASSLQQCKAAAIAWAFAADPAQLPVLLQAERNLLRKGAIKGVSLLLHMQYQQSVNVTSYFRVRRGACVRMPAAATNMTRNHVLQQPIPQRQTSMAATPTQTPTTWRSPLVRMMSPPPRQGLPTRPAHKLRLCAQCARRGEHSATTPFAIGEGRKRVHWADGGINGGASCGVSNGGVTNVFAATGSVQPSMAVVLTAIRRKAATTLAGVVAAAAGDFSGR
ncbi:hypothetical protein JKP88DRAFT_245254 [Tribonema minus]|uniref:Uncharacterized protein n=1 Tax=Tribonema minus TaxID=303371 RepID=A0A835YZ35_9STRA|nr:hypothetical protein JKP88DRAFT_245254 [Tribonema minus]